MNKEELKLQEERKIQDLLSQPYSTENWLKIAQDVFPGVTPIEYPKQEIHESDKVKSFRQIGNVRLNDGKNLAMFEVKIAPNVNIPRNRVELRNLLSKFIDQEKNHGVLVIYEQGKEDYRFTFTSKSSDVDEETSAEIKKETDPKRFTYLLGKNQKCRTAAKRLYTIKEKKEKGNNIEIGDIVNAFNVGKLNEEFFEGYRKIYGEFTKAITGLDENMKGSGRAMNGFSSFFSGDTEKAKKEARDFIKKMMGRIIFLYFVQKKGWLGVPINGKWGDGNQDFMKRLFDLTKEKNNFYSKVLVPLFYKNLNTKRPNDLIDLKKGLFDDKIILETKVPYLNGGLFADDKFQTNILSFPGEKEIFTALFEFLDRYNFTIDEDNELDHTIAVDPEMLGHIFENLLEDNKEMGAFYTPKEIVHYMCQESLTEYLCNILNKRYNINEPDLKKNIAEFIIKDDRTYIEGKEKYIAQALYDVKICDPAIGSGAFPMGLLHEIHEAIITLKNIKEVKDIWDLKGDEFDEAKIKSQIIRNSIYGVDIENGAVDIARLRFWLSLIVNELEPKPLPNLDYKIMQGNSLLESFGEIDLSIVPKKPKSGEIPFYTDEDGFTVSDVEKLRSAVGDFFNQADQKEKQKIKEGINQTILDFIKAKVNSKQEVLENEIEEVQKKLQTVKRSGNNTNAVKAKKEKAIAKFKVEIQVLEKRIKELLRQQNELIEMGKTQSHNFFMWHLWFADVFEGGGFDIVIANPPYDVYEGTKKNEIESLLIDEVFTKCKSGKLNAYELFLAKTEHFLKIDGVNIQIFQNSFLADDSAKGLRKHYLKDNKILKIDSFPERDDPSKRVFKNVKMSVCIMKSINSKTNDYTFDVFFHRDRTLNNFSYVSYSKSEISVFDSDKNIIPRLLENEKVIFKQYYLSKNNLKLDSLFNCLEGELNMTFHKGYMKTDKKLPLIVKGAQVQRYYLTDKPSQGVVQFVDKKKYLSDHHLQSRIALQGITGANDKIRIVSTLIDPMTFCANSCNYIICNPDNNKISLKTILGLINSKITNWIFRKTSTNSNVNCYEINNLRFPLGLEAFDSKISTYVSTILEKTKQGKDTFKEENEIDKILFKLYDIESDEIEKHF
jgi:Alw26I/Eco31I/Esp3I family type II restriction m6 adenine DNA methyltransferase